MTDVFERPVSPQEPEHAPFELSMPARVVLAVLSAGAGVIHLVMMPSHWGEWTAEGVGFAAAGWFGLVVALAVLTRPSRGLLVTAIVGNLVLIGLWAVSRIWGFPVGPHEGHAESVAFLDVSCVLLEAAFVVAAGVLVARPGVLRRSAEAFAIAGAVSIGVIALSTAALASPDARNHALGAHGAHGDEGAGVAEGEAAAGHDDSGAGHDDAATVANVASTNDKGLAALSNGHHTEMGAEQPLSAEERELLSQQIDASIAAARQYPTVAAAMAAGYWRAGPYSPGLGAHYIRTNGPALNTDGVVSIEDALNPMSIIYEGTAPDSKVAGFMYYSMSKEKPEGFAGPNDVWHYHTNTCIKPVEGGGIDAPFGADGEVTKKQCEAVGGNLLEQTQWMVHVWSVPGWESRQGLFGEVNPALSCPDGTYYQLPIERWIEQPLDTCKSAT